MKPRKHRWTAKELKYLERFYNRHSIEALKQKIPHTEYAIRWQASKMGLTSRMIIWTQAEISFVKKNQGVLSIAKIASKLKKSEKAISHKIQELKVSKAMDTIMKAAIITENEVPYLEGKAGKYRAKLMVMEIGHSFEYPSIERQTLQNQVKLFKSRKFKTENLGYNKRRIWRLK